MALPHSAEPEKHEQAVPIPKAAANASRKSKAAEAGEDGEQAEAMHGEDDNASAVPTTCASVAAVGGKRARVVKASIETKAQTLVKECVSPKRQVISALCTSIYLTERFLMCLPRGCEFSK